MQSLAAGKICDLGVNDSSDEASVNFSKKNSKNKMQQFRTIHIMIRKQESSKLLKM
jgi:hypothetical protein